MSTVWQEALDENARQVERHAKEAAAIRMLKGGEIAMEEIANYTDLPLVDVQDLAKAVSLGTV